MLIIKRNEIAKWQRKGEISLDFDETFEDDHGEIVKLPPLKTSNRSDMNHILQKML